MIDKGEVLVILLLLAIWHRLRKIWDDILKIRISQVKNEYNDENDDDDHDF